MTGAALPSSLTRRTIGAARWRFASSAVQGGAQFGVGILLSRLLPPRDFGLAGLALIVIGFTTMLADLGLGPALVQRPVLTTRHLRAAFAASMLAGIAVAGLLYLLAPLAAKPLRNAALPPVLRAEALLFVFTGLGVVARAMLRRALDYRRLFIVEVTSYLLGYIVVAVTLVLLGAGVWGLVVGALSQAMLGSVLAISLVRHPMRPLLAGTELRELAGFGVGASVSQIVGYIARNGDNLVVGRSLGTAALGLYGRAYGLMLLPVNYVAAAMNSVLFPAFAEIAQDRVRLARAYLVSVQICTLVAAPLMAGMIVAAPALIPGLYGPAWHGAITPFQVLCLAGICRTVYPVSAVLVQAVGDVYTEARRQVVYAALVLAGSIIGVHYGLAWVAAGVSLAIVYMYLAMARVALRILDLRWRAFLTPQLPGLVLGCLVGAITLALRLVLQRSGIGPLGILLALVAGGVGAIPLGLYLMPPAIRPGELLRRAESSVGRCPRFLEAILRWVLHLPWPSAGTSDELPPPAPGSSRRHDAA
jgi:teichuronic acid exporter